MTGTDWDYTLPFVIILEDSFRRENVPGRAPEGGWKEAKIQSRHTNEL